MKFLKLMRLSFLALAIILPSVLLKAQTKQHEKIEDAIEVLKNFGTMEETIPRQLLNVTEGIIIVPKMINAGFVVGGKRGKGIAMVKKANGTWSNPVFVTITGGSFGFQIGVQSVDLVLIFKHSKPLMNIGKGSFTIGGDISAAAGPVGRSSSANTDYKLDAEVYSYSRSKGLFAGVTINGASLSVDKTANSNFYNEELGSRIIFINPLSKAPIVTELITTLTGLYK